MGSPVVPDVKMMTVPGFSGLDGCFVEWPSRMSATLGMSWSPSVQASRQLVAVDLLGDRQELLVEDDELRPFAVGELGELRAAGHGVEHQDPCTGLHDGDHRHDDVAVVARQHRDRVARLDTALVQGVRELVDLVAQLGPRDLAEVVDDGGLVRESRSTGGDRGGKARPPLDQLVAGDRQSVRQLGLGEPDLAEHLQAVREVTHCLLLFAGPMTPEQ